MLALGIVLATWVIRSENKLLRKNFVSSLHLLSEQFQTG